MFVYEQEGTNHTKDIHRQAVHRGCWEQKHPPQNTKQKTYPRDFFLESSILHPPHQLTMSQDNQKKRKADDAAQADSMKNCDKAKEILSEAFENPEQ
jgi:hypothetical protein